jgi:tRNA threonylcarbamoyladenosine biosynthesis protein TsaE
MSTEQTWQIATSNLEATLQLGAKIGSRLRGGEIIELLSDIGGGKTTFTRGIVTGAGSVDAVRSPSFTIRNEYRADALTMHHFDFYRLDDPGIMAVELMEVLEDPQAVIIIEWAEIVASVLPENHIRISITTTSDTTREFTISCPKKYNYLTENLTS